MMYDWGYQGTTPSHHHFPPPLSAHRPVASFPLGDVPNDVTSTHFSSTSSNKVNAPLQETVFVTYFAMLPFS